MLLSIKHLHGYLKMITDICWLFLLDFHTVSLLLLDWSPRFFPQAFSCCFYSLGAGGAVTPSTSVSTKFSYFDSVGSVDLADTRLLVRT